MIRKLNVAALSVALILGAAIPAAAQVSKQSGVSIRAGFAFPTSSGSSSKNSVFAAGLDYKLSNLSMQGMPNTTSAYYGFSVDYLGKNSARSVPVVLTVTGRNNEFFYTAGAGVAFNQFPNGAANRNQSQFAYMFGLGYDFQSGQNPFFVEAKYLGTTQTQLNGVGFYVGVRF